MIGKNGKRYAEVEKLKTMIPDKPLTKREIFDLIDLAAGGKKLGTKDIIDKIQMYEDGEVGHPPFQFGIRLCGFHIQFSHDLMNMYYDDVERIQDLDYKLTHLLWEKGTEEHAEEIRNIITEIIRYCARHGIFFLPYCREQNDPNALLADKFSNYSPRVFLMACNEDATEEDVADLFTRSLLSFNDCPVLQATVCCKPRTAIPSFQEMISAMHSLFKEYNTAVIKEYQEKKEVEEYKHRHESTTRH